MIRLLLLAALLAPQDDAEDFLRRLGDPDPAVREKASADLAARGDAGRPVIEKARESKDPEVRSRATALLLKIDQAFYLKTLERAQRMAKFTTRADAANPSPESTVFTDGAKFVFERRPYVRARETLGTIVETRMEPGLQGTIEWSVAEVRGAASLETCDVHSPQVVYVPGPPLEQATVVVKGLRRWAYDVPLEFKNPSEGQTQRLGPITVSLAWPCVVVTADVPIDAAILNQVLKSDEIVVKLKPNVNRFGGRASFVVVAACGRGLALIDPPTWCGCKDKPAKLTRPPVEKLQELKVSPRSNAPLEDIESISLTLHLPVEEPFEVISPPLK